MTSDWFKDQYIALKTNPIVRENTRKSLFCKLSYVMNVTKVKINLNELKGLTPKKEEGEHELFNNQLE